MKQTAEQKSAAGMALNLTELSKVTGWGLSSLRSMRLPLLKGKIREEDFWRIVRRWQDDNISFDLSRPMHPPWPSGAVIGRDLQTIADKFRAPRSSNGRKDASPCRAECQPHNNE